MAQFFHATMWSREDSQGEVYNVIIKRWTIQYPGSGVVFDCIYFQGWKNPLVRSPWRVPYAVGRVEILTVSNVKY